MASASDSVRVARTDSALATTVDGEAVILETESGTYYGLNEVATVVWDAIEEPRSKDALCDEICSQYDVEPERVERDLEEALSTMEDNGIVELDPDA